MSAGLGALRPELEVVICTYDNAPLLDRTLAALASQRPTDGRWSALVVDNNSSDETRSVVARHIGAGGLPGLSLVDEPQQGLTPARLRGVAATTAAWIAFVDDDCLLDEGWVSHAIAFARAHPDAGGFGGRVTPVYDEHAPPVVHGYGWAFAEQDLGDETVPVDCLVGAGMVLSRVAIEASGWPDRPFFADRVGRSLVSGGDVEIALRVASTGRALWYEPACQLHHQIPAARTTMHYLVRITGELGIAHSLAHALTWRRSRAAWLRAVVTELAASLVLVLKVTRQAVRRTRTWSDLRLAVSYELGRWRGMARVLLLLSRGRCHFFGRCRPAVVGPGPGRDHAVRPA